MRGKKYKKIIEALNVAGENKVYSLDEAIDWAKANTFTKFDSTIDLACNLSIKKSTTVRDSLTFPHIFRGEKKILVFAKGEKATDAKDAGATYVGDDDLISKIREGWIDFDVAIATPDMMKDVGKLGAILGKKGLMPNPRTKTVTTDIKETVLQFKKGRTEFKTDKAGVVHMSFGKASMDGASLKENAHFFMKELMQKKTNDMKGNFLKTIFISSSMGPSLSVDIKEFVS